MSSRLTEWATKARRGGVEYLRLASILQVLWYHATPNPIGLAGPAGLMAVAVALAARTRLGTKKVELIRKRMQRILVPFFFWSCVYGVIGMARNLATGKPVSSFFKSWMVLTGTEIHLWYLPCCFLFTVVIAILAAGGHLPLGRWGSLEWAVAAGGAIWMAAWILRFVPDDYGFSLYNAIFRWVWVTPSVFVGLSLTSMSDGPEQRRVGLIALPSVVVLSCLSTWACGYHQFTFYSVGVLACVLAWAARIKVTPFLTWAGSLVYGIYLMHYGVQTLLNKVFHIKRGLLMFLLVTLISASLAAGARRTRLRAFV